MADKNDITFEIMEHIGTIDVIDGREEKWTKPDKYDWRY